MKKADKVSDHIPVLLSDFSSLLPEISGVWIDGTFGYGGYSRGLLNSGATKVIAIDMDPDVLSRAKDFERKWPKKFKILAGNFCYMNELVALPENIDQSKAKRLFNEFTSAWEKTPLKDKIGWCHKYNEYEIRPIYVIYLFDKNLPIKFFVLSL